MSKIEQEAFKKWATLDQKEKAKHNGFNGFVKDYKFKEKLKDGLS